MKYWYMLQHEWTLKTMLSERTQTQKTTYYMIPFILSAKIGKYMQTESRFVVARGWRIEEIGEWLLIDTEFVLGMMTMV